MTLCLRKYLQENGGGRLHIHHDGANGWPKCITVSRFIRHSLKYRRNIDKRTNGSNIKGMNYHLIWSREERRKDLITLRFFLKQNMLKPTFFFFTPGTKRVQKSHGHAEGKRDVSVHLCFFSPHWKVLNKMHQCTHKRMQLRQSERNNRVTVNYGEQLIRTNVGQKWKAAV